MKRAIGVLSVALLAAVAAPAFAGSLTIRGGAFFPSADSNLFDDVSELYTREPGSQGLDGLPIGVEDGDWIGFRGGIEYSFRLVPNTELGFHLDGYWRSMDTFSREFTRPDGREIPQTLELSSVPLGFTFRIVPTKRSAKVAPYVGVGADLIFWEYKEFGEFVDFESPNPNEPDILSDAFFADGVTGGLHVVGGLRVFFSHDFGLEAEFKYEWAKTDMGDDFRPREPGLVNQLDLGGASATLGFHIRF